MLQFPSTDTATAGTVAASVQYFCNFILSKGLSRGHSHSWGAALPPPQAYLTLQLRLPEEALFSLCHQFPPKCQGRKHLSLSSESSSHPALVCPDASSLQAFAHCVYSPLDMHWLLHFHYPCIPRVKIIAPSRALLTTPLLGCDSGTEERKKNTEEQMSQWLSPPSPASV